MDVGRSLTGTETASNLLLIKSGVRRCDRHGIIATSMTIPLQISSSAAHGVGCGATVEPVFAGLVTFKRPTNLR